MNTCTSLHTPPFSKEYCLEYIKNMEHQLSELYTLYGSLKYERFITGNPEVLINTLFCVIWEQFTSKITLFLGEDFIKENHGLFLNLSNDAHIQTTENFIAANFAIHNPYIDFEQRYNDWQSNFKKDEYGCTIKKIDSRTELEKEVLTKEARLPYDANRPCGSSSINIDHTISAAEIIRDPDANAHLTLEERINFANSPANLNPLDAAANRSKGDSDMKTWLFSKRNGKTPAERFNLNQKILLEKANNARKAYQSCIAIGQAKSYETGRLSQKEETFRIRNKVIESTVITLLAQLLKVITHEMISWLQNKEKSWNSFWKQIETAITDFVTDLNHIITIGKATITTIATAIYGTIISTINKIWLLIQQGGHSFREAMTYIKNPENKNKSFSVLALEIGKIFITGLTGAGAIILSEVIEKELLKILLPGNIANLLGNFFGAMTSGIIGALFLYWIDILLAKWKNNQLSIRQSETMSKIIQTETQISYLNNLLYEKARNRFLFTYKHNMEEFYEYD